jgi:hypothetical protein
MKIEGAFAALGALALPAAALAQDGKSLASPQAAMRGFYLGVGGSFNWSEFDQALPGVSGGDRCPARP